MKFQVVYFAAIASVESDLKPYTIGVSGKSVKASSKEEAKQIIKQYLAKDITNIAKLTL